MQQEGGERGRGPCPLAMPWEKARRQGRQDVPGREEPPQVFLLLAVAHGCGQVLLFTLQSVRNEQEKAKGAGGGTSTLLGRGSSPRGALLPSCLAPGPSTSGPGRKLGG